MKAGLALLLLAAPAADSVIGPPPYRLLPSAKATPPPGTAALPGSIVARAVLGRPDSALLTMPVRLDKLGQTRAWPQGTTLGASSVSGVAGVTDAYCEDEQQGSIGKLVAGQMLFGLVGMLRPTKMITRFCLFDKDADGSLDHAFLIGAKGKDNRAPFAIPPARFGLISGMALGGDSEVVLRYAGPSGAGGALRFDLELVGYGRMRRIGGTPLEIAPASLPDRLQAGSAVLMIDRFDKPTNAAHIRIERGLSHGRMHIADAPRGD